MKFLFQILFALVSFPWYILMTAEHGTGFLSQTFIHENIRRFFYAEHKSLDRIYIYPFAVIFGFFPWSTFVPLGLIYGWREGLKKHSKNARSYLLLSLTFLLPFVFFTCAKSKLLSYIFPVFPSVALLTGAWLVCASVRAGSVPSSPCLKRRF